MASVLILRVPPLVAALRVTMLEPLMTAAMTWALLRSTQIAHDSGRSQTLLVTPGNEGANNVRTYNWNGMDWQLLSTTGPTRPAGTSRPSHD